MSKPTAELRTKRLILRRWREADREPFARMNADPVVMEFFPALLSRQESDAGVDRLEAGFAQRGFGFWAAELRGSGEYIGSIGLSVPHFQAPFLPCVEIGWRLAAEHWGKGLATEGAQAAAEYGFRTLKLAEIVSFTTTTNQCSRRLMEKLGMTHDPQGDFDHPLIPAGHPLCRHVLYRLRNATSAS